MFGDFNVHHKDWLTYSGGTDRSGELCFYLSISNDLTQMLNFLTRIPDCNSHSPALLEWVQVGIDVYIPLKKCQVKPHSSPWFSASCATTIVHGNHFFRLYENDKSSYSKVKFRHVSNCCK